MTDMPLDQGIVPELIKSLPESEKVLGPRTAVPMQRDFDNVI